MSSAAVLAVDGGNSKTDLALVNADGDPGIEEGDEGLGGALARLRPRWIASEVEPLAGMTVDRDRRRCSRDQSFHRS